MRIKSLLPALSFLALCFSASQGRGAVIDLQEYAFNIDGVVTNGSQPAGVNGAGFNYTTGLGSLSISMTGTGNHFIGLYLDHEIDQTINTFFNELGSTLGVKPAGLSWEIGDPLGAFIYPHFTSSNAAGSALTNSNTLVSPDDVSMAQGWNFSLAAGQTGIFNFNVGLMAPAGFYLQQTDPSSGASIFFSTTKTITTAGTVPDSGATLPLMFAGAFLVFAMSRMSRLSASAAAQP